MAEKKDFVIVVYPGFNLLELVGAQHILLSALMMGGYRVSVAAEARDPLATDTSLRYIPQKTFAELPSPDALLVVGGGEAGLRAADNKVLVEYVRRAGQAAGLVAAVDTGVLVLAAAGLVQGCRAATHWAYKDVLEQAGAHYQPDPYVEDGRVITAAGVSGAVDMALRIAERLAGQKTARFAQITAEYDPVPPFGGLDLASLPLTAAEARALPTAVRPGEKKIAMVIYDGLTVFDLIGPLQALSVLNRLDATFQPVVVAKTTAPVTSDAGLTFLPEREFADLPHPHALVVPGGGPPTLRAMTDPAIRAYLRGASASAEQVLSVCTGALLLGAIGLLEGRPATTHWGYTGVLNALGARYQHERWVEEGRVITSAGVSAGMDSSLYLISRLAGEETARKVQAVLQYDPHPPFGPVDWRRLNPLFRALRGLNTLQAPFLARKTRALTRRGL